MDLWLVVKSGVEGKYYPLESLHVEDNGWNVPERKICTALGSQIIQLYLVPKTADGSLYTYALDGSQHLVGIGAMPTGSVREAQAQINVSGSSTDC